MCVPGCQEALHAALSRRRILQGSRRRGLCRHRESAPGPKEASDAAGAASGQRYFKGVVDLTHTMSPEFPTFFGVPGIELQKQYDFKKDGFNLNWWRIIEHAGTHLDAPIHFSENGATADTIVAGELVVPLAVIDVRKQAEKNPDYLMGIEDVLSLGEAVQEACRTCCVAMLSGWGKHVGDRRQVHRQGRQRHVPFSRLLAGACRMAAEGAQRARAWRSTRCRSTTVRRRISRPITSGCRPADGVWRMSPTWKSCRRRGRRWWWALPKVKDATGGPVRLIALI